jgi:glycosyltransferase involved in cell wall biosynthesis
VIVNSEATRASLPHSEKVALVYNGLEINPGDPARQDALRREFGLAGDEIGVAVIGKIYPGKGQGQVAEAAALLRSKYPRLKLFLVGEIKDASYAASIRAAVRSAGREDRVVWTGYVPDLTNFLKLMSAVVSASVVESFGRAALEGMAAGVPVLAVRAGGLAEIIEPGANGDLVASPEPKALAAALDALLSDETRRKAHVEGGYETIRKKFSVSRQVRDVENLLADILGGEERKIVA